MGFKKKVDGICYAVEAIADSARKKLHIVGVSSDTFSRAFAQLDHTTPPRGASRKKTHSWTAEGKLAGGIPALGVGSMDETAEALIRGALKDPAAQAAVIRLAKTPA